MAEGFGTSTTNTTLMEFVIPEASVLDVLSRCSEKLLQHSKIGNLVTPVRDSITNLIKSGAENIRRVKMSVSLNDEKGHISMLSVTTSGTDDDKVKLNISMASQEFTILPEYVRVEVGSGNAVRSTKGYEMVPIKPVINEGHLRLAITEISRSMENASAMLDSL